MDMDYVQAEQISLTWHRIVGNGACSYAALSSIWVYILNNHCKTVINLANCNPPIVQHKVSMDRQKMLEGLTLLTPVEC